MPGLTGHLSLRLLNRPKPPSRPTSLVDGIEVHAKGPAECRPHQRVGRAVAFHHLVRGHQLQARMGLRQIGLAAQAPMELGRSEEHTSELQSPCNLVCRLLLEKKKKNECKYVNRCIISKV